IFAAIGYYASAYELLYSAFLTGGTLLLAYVIYGIIKRAITVAQRQILYRQAMDRREAELKARAEKIKAEQLGEDAPPLPPLDTETIDVSSVTRQSLQLLNTIIVLVTVLFLWMNWSSLLPALTIFDGFELGSINTGLLDEDGREIIRSVTLWTVLQSSLILILTFIAAKNFPSFTEIFVLSRLGVDSGVRYAVKTIMGYVIIAFGVIWAFNKIGLQWSQLRWVVTGLSVGIGFGLQKIIANFISGLIILFERPVRIGDYVTIGDQSGTVSKIKIRATTLNDLDNREILIPNEALISERVTNWTLSNSITRLIVPVGIAYGSDTDGARDIMLDAVKALPKILDMPAPQVLFIGFGDSSLDFEVRVFLSSFEELVPMRHVVHTEINKALASAGFAIPFPQRDLNIVSQGVPLAINTAQSPEKPKT
ncbi:MAG: mechanosensitive ion channel domain-containing protein, partial [Litorimonas sp.]